VRAKSNATANATGRSRKKVGNPLLRNFVAHSRELRESPAWRVLPDNGHRLLGWIELIHMRRAGKDNGSLPCTYGEFVRQAGLRRASISLAIRQCVALGFLEVTERGKLAISGYRSPSLYRLTYVWGRVPGVAAPTNEWREIKTAAEAQEALAFAADDRNWHTQRPAPRRALTKAA
jgi:hypothetical protein